MQHKIGDTFLYLLTVKGVNPGELAGYTPTCQVRSQFGVLYGQAVCSWADVGTLDQLTLFISDTSQWKPGVAELDVQFTRDFDGFTRSTKTITFSIVQDVTRPGSSSITSTISPPPKEITATLDRAVPVGTGGGSASAFTWTQDIPLSVWTIAHNLGRFPSVTVVDLQGRKVEPDISYVDNTTLQITHGAAYAGKAFLN